MKRYTRDEMLKYSKRVIKLRRKIGLSQERVAEDIRMSYSTYRKVTNGEISINNANIENISLDNIYGKTKDKNEEWKKFYY